MPDSERQYVDLLFRASKKYASWDPELAVEVGDWGRITAGRPGWAFWRRQRGTFLKEGNIYTDKIAEKYGIPAPKEYGVEATEGVTWVASQNAQELDISGSAGGQTPVLANCSIKAGFQFSSGSGAVLAMNNDTITTIDPAGCLRRLLDDETLRDCVVVSEVHRCSSYARYLSSPNTKSITMGLSVEPPVSGVASAKADVKWVRSTTTGNFKSKVDKSEARVFYPLFRLVSLKETATAVGLRGSWDGDIPPLPDAQPPWMDGEA
ncbi:hypothetical protein BV22DRAFT_1018462 [Leucogyrophana mollusca]|uniref:Uncharacterized protein n=1 Tax=Leucogyrophana mollusca TaxID=85980 RepID=A0ACB8B8A2_9AGAM|nr:hypothetical protein BV22DRAFT_1018462 [Leucogyrophana mollusca]